MARRQPREGRGLAFGALFRGRDWPRDVTGPGWPQGGAGTLGGLLTRRGRSQDPFRGPAVAARRGLHSRPLLPPGGPRPPYGGVAPPKGPQRTTGTPFAKRGTSRRSVSPYIDNPLNSKVWGGAAPASAPRQLGPLAPPHPRARVN